MLNSNTLGQMIGSQLNSGGLMGRMIGASQLNLNTSNVGSKVGCTKGAESDINDTKAQDSVKLSNEAANGEGTDNRVGGILGAFAAAMGE